MGYVIERSEIGVIKRIPTWVLIYGRRKTGKTFLVKNFTNFDKYFFVRKDLLIVDEKEINVREFPKIVRKLLRNKKTVVIDEFQRLPEQIIEEIFLEHPKGKLILLGSSLRIIRKLFGKSSVIMGKIATYKLGLLSWIDIFSFLAKKFGYIKAFEISPYFKEPWLIEYLDMYEGDVIKFLYDILKLNFYTIKSLIGEIFDEEDRELTERYYSILVLLGKGVWNAKKISGELFERGLIESPDTGAVRPYLKILREMDLVEKFPIINRRELLYKIRSPLIDLYFKVLSKYEEEFPRFDEIKGLIERKFFWHIEDFVGEIFEDIFGGKRVYYFSPSEEFDIIIKKKRGIEAIIEVKWKEKVKKSEVEKFIERAEELNPKNIILFTKRKQDFGIKVITPEDILRLSKRDTH